MKQKPLMQCRPALGEGFYPHRQLVYPVATETPILLLDVVLAKAADKPKEHCW